MVNVTLRPLYPVEITPDTNEEDARWTPELVWTFCKKKNLLPLARIEPRKVQPVV